MKKSQTGRSLHMVFALFEYVPFGGMQNDMLRIARECIGRGHHVEIYADYWKGKRPDNIEVTIVPVKGIQNHKRCKSFSDSFLKISSGMDRHVTVGFNKMPGLDVYFCADTCFAAKAETKTFLYRLTGRCRTYLYLERSVFSEDSKTMILMLSRKEKDIYQKFYRTPDERFFLLPPGISRDCLLPEDAMDLRRRFRKKIGIPEESILLLMVGSHFRTKGVDRSLHALASLPSQLLDRVYLVIVGEDKKRQFERLAKRLKVRERVKFMGGRNDVRYFLFAADILLHPSYRENTGTVIVEALAAGLPVLATDVCGYAMHVSASKAGRLIPSPFEQERMNKLLLEMILSDERETWKRNATAYIGRTDVFSLPQKAADIIEQVASNRL